MIKINDNNEIKINIGKVSLDASDLKIDSNSKNISKIEAPKLLSYSFELTDEHLLSFKKHILRKYKDNMQRCSDCEYCTIILDDDGRFKDLECNLGASKQEMISNSGCLLIYRR